MVASATTDFVVAIFAAIGSILGSTWAIKAVIKHEMKMCELRLQAFKDGLHEHEEGHHDHEEDT